MRVSHAVSTAFVCTLSAHLAAEAIRRFVLFSNWVYLVADVLVLLSAIVVFRLTKLHVPALLSALFLSYIVWGAVCLALDSGSPLLLVVGARPLILAFSAYIVARGFFATAQSPIRTMEYALFAWTLLALLVGLLQLYAGLGSPINRLPEGAFSESAGIGDYDVAGVGLEGIFRPTSIFMHTGRLGQFAFAVALVLIVLAILRRRTSIRDLLFALVGITLILLSGQRAALLFVILASLVLIIATRDFRLLYRVFLVLGVAMIAVFFVNAELGDLIWNRFSSVVGSIGDRLAENTSDAVASIERFPVVGKGLGYFSFGGRQYGGDIYYEYMAQFGHSGNENSWLRIQGETGILGLLLFAMLVFSVTVRSLREFRLQRDPEARAIHFAAGTMAISLTAWAFTHDVFANYLFLMQWFTLCGASRGYFLRRTVVNRLSDAGLSGQPSALSRDFSA